VSLFQLSFDRRFDVALPVTVFLKCQPNLSLREQPLLPMLDVFGADWVGEGGV